MATDKMIDDLEPGELLGPLEYTLTPEAARSYADAHGEEHSWYRDGSPFGGPIALATMVHSDKLRLWERHCREEPWPYRTVLHQFDAEFINPAMVGEKITTKAKCVDKYWKRDRQYMLLEVESFGEDGRPISRYRDTTLLRYKKETRR